MSEAALNVRPSSVRVAEPVVHDGFPALRQGLAGCRRRYLLVDFDGAHPVTGPWRQYRSALDVIVLRGEVRLEWTTAGATSVTTVRAGELGSVAAGCRHRLVVDRSALFELYLPPDHGGTPG